MSVSQDTSAPGADPGCGDKRRLVKTKTPGVFKRVDGAGRTIGYVCIFRSAGRQRKRHAGTYEAARRIKRESETDRDRGELQERTTITFLRYLDEWVERYRGQGRRGFRENTRDEYRRLIRAYARPHFSGRLKAGRADHLSTGAVPGLACRPRGAGQAPQRPHDRQRRNADPRGAGDREARGPDPPQPRSRPRAAPARAGHGRAGGDQGLQPRATRRDPGNGPGASPAALRAPGDLWPADQRGDRPPAPAPSA